jgi:hypothetical protein
MMKAMWPKRDADYEDELSALEVAMTSLETQVATVNDTIAALSLSNTTENTVNVSGGGATLWQGSLAASESATIANGLEFAQINSFIVKSGSGVYGFSSGGIGPGQSFNVDNVVIEITVGGDLVVTAPASNSFDVTVAFTSVPLMAGGIVGPIGATGGDGATPYIQAGNWWIDGVDTGIAATGPAGEDGITITAWTSLSFSANWSTYSGAGSWGACQYRLFDDIVQLRGLADCSAAWAGNETIATLPVGYRPANTKILRTLCHNNQSCRIDVYNTGGVRFWPQGASTTGWVSLDGLSFYLN